MSIKSIGIIGHREINKDDIPKIQKALDEWLQNNENRFKTHSKLYTWLASFIKGIRVILKKSIKERSEPFK